MIRWTETNKWSDSWYADLPAEEKLLWLFMCDTCDAAGVFDWSDKVIVFHVGNRIDKKAWMEKCGSRVENLTKTKVWITGFCEFQYRTLSRKTPAQRKVFESLEKHGILQQPQIMRLLKYEADGAYRNGAKNEIDIDTSEARRPIDAPRLTELKAFAAKQRIPAGTAEQFFNHYEAVGWLTGNNVQIRDWKAKLKTWHQQNKGEVPATEAEMQAAGEQDVSMVPVADPWAIPDHLPEQRLAFLRAGGYDAALVDKWASVHPSQWPVGVQKAFKKYLTP